MNYTSVSQYRYGADFEPSEGFSQDQVKNEPMFFNSDLVFAYNNGDVITRSFIEAFTRDCAESRVKNLRDFVFDSRVHMLMPGWYPCIPGFHHDDVPRHPVTGQPDYRNEERYRSQHVMGLVNGDICPTEFALGKTTLEIPRSDQIIYKLWHEEVDSLINLGELQFSTAKSGKLLYFDCDTFHQGTAAKGNGWRWFGRISWNTDRVKHITNEIRRQVQVYLEFPMEGW